MAIIKKPVVSIYLDVRHTNSEGKHAVKIRVFYNGNGNKKAKFYSVFGKGDAANNNLYLTKQDFEKMYSSKPRKEYKELRAEIDLAKDKIQSIVDGMKVFSWIAFDEAIRGRRDAWKTVKDGFDSYVNDKDLSEKSKTGYYTAYNSFKDFFGTSSVHFNDISAKKLKEYKDKASLATTTISMYLRCLRAVFNYGIELGFLIREDYPFKGLEIPIAKGRKMALSKRELQKIFEYKPKDTKEALRLSLWKFMYMANGLNAKDLFKLKFNSIIHGMDGQKVIRYQRTKTARTKKKFEDITILILPQMQEIIEAYGNDPKPQNFIFRILEEGLSEKTVNNRTATAIKHINETMKEVCRELGILQKVTTYTARHSFAKMLAINGTPISFISHAMGHSSIPTTQSYLNSFDDEEIHKAASGLVAFGESVEDNIKPINKASH